MRSQPYTSDIFYLILKVYKNVFTACVPRRGGGAQNSEWGGRGDDKRYTKTQHRIQQKRSIVIEDSQEIAFPVCLGYSGPYDLEKIEWNK